MVCLASVFAVTASAQGRLSPSQTELSNTTINGSVQDGVFGSFQNLNVAGSRPLQEFYRHQRNVSTSLTPIPPSPPNDFDGLIIFSVGVNYPIGEGFYSTGSDLFEESRTTALMNQPVLPPIILTPTQDSSSLFQSSSLVLMSVDSFYSQTAISSGIAQNVQSTTFTIQSVPEPSSVVMLALGIMAVVSARSRRSRIQALL